MPKPQETVTGLRCGSGPEPALPAPLRVSAAAGAGTVLGTLRRIDGGGRLARAPLRLQKTFCRRTQ